LALVSLAQSFSQLRSQVFFSYFTALKVTKEGEVRISGRKQLANAQLTWLRPAPPEDET